MLGDQKSQFWPISQRSPTWRRQGVNLSKLCIFRDQVDQVENFGINSAVDGFLDAGWSVAARLKFDARQHSAGGREPYFTSHA